MVQIAGFAHWGQAKAHPLTKRYTSSKLHYLSYLALGSWLKTRIFRPTVRTQPNARTQGSPFTRASSAGLTGKRVIGCLRSVATSFMTPRQPEQRSEPEGPRSRVPRGIAKGGWASSPPWLAGEGERRARKRRSERANGAVLLAARIDWSASKAMIPCRMRVSASSTSSWMPGISAAPISTTTRSISTDDTGSTRHHAGAAYSPTS